MIEDFASIGAALIDLKISQAEIEYLSASLILNQLCLRLLCEALVVSLQTGVLSVHQSGVQGRFITVLDRLAVTCLSAKCFEMQTASFRCFLLLMT